ncbi:amino acid adenylation domain-containing protein [Legionella geestiana]|nr:amino acid adenylation domain-containing protein [Legionella geestiana]
MTFMRLSCCLTGEDSLLIQCANRLLAGGHCIVMVVSSCRKVHAFARDHGIPCTTILEDVEKNSIPALDYIFSIVNSRILPPSILALPRFGVINYHDSLLPKFAGLNATSWAILEGETVHGVTWHKACDRVDGGDILCQQRFTIPENATAVMLNLLCYEAAIRSFETLLSMLEKGEAHPHPQNLQERTWYGRRTPLPNLGFIDWRRQSAVQISRLFRALQFGHYPNTVGTLRLGIGKTCYSVTEFTILPETPANKVPPGTLLGHDRKGLRVRLKDAEVDIGGFFAMDGTPVSADTLLVRHGLAAGVRLPSPSASMLAAIALTFPMIARHEPWWVARLQESSTHGMFTKASMVETPQTLVLPLRNFSAHLPQDEPSARMFSAAVLLYLFRLNNHEKTTVHIALPFSEEREASGDFFARHLPLVVAPDASLTLEGMLEYTDSLLKSLQAHQTFCQDVAVRYPLLAKACTEPLLLLDCEGQAVTPESALLHFSLDKKAREIRVTHRLNLQATQGIFQEFLHHLPFHLANLFDGFAHNPHALAADFCFLSALEQNLLLEQWGRGAVRKQDSLSLFARFEAVARRSPKRTALCQGACSMTYEELLTASFKVAQTLENAGVTPGSGVGIYLGRSPAFLAVLFGILRAGCWYVPLETKFPLPKTASLMKAARLKYLFTSEALSQKLASLSEDTLPDTVFLVDEGWADIPQMPVPAFVDAVSPDTLAAVVFTSGTSGVPKGVMVTIGNILNYCDWFLNSTAFDEDGIIDFSSSIAFDLSVPCSIAPLLAGGTIALCDESVKANPRRYLQHLHAHQVTHVEATPGYLELMLEYPEDIKKLDSLRCLLLGADIVRANDVRKWLALCPEHQVFNEYGPTEATVSVTAYRVVAASLAVDAQVPIGRPGHNSICLVLDRHQNLCPVGMKGELCIGGAQVTRGYLFREDLTRARFLEPSRFPGAGRVYRTGDVASWLPCGSLQFAGREDHQIKLHGFRIELSEVETALLSMPHIRQAVAWVEEATGERHLAACLVTEGKVLTTDAVRAFLSAHLPLYMVPSEIFFVDAIPLQENEKIDLRTIRQIGERRRAVAPSLPGKKTLQDELWAIWQSLFNGAVLSRDMDFFALGGDSLSAVRLIAEVRTRFGIAPGLTSLFEHSTFERFARHVYALCAEAKKGRASLCHEGSPLVNLSPRTGALPLFLVHPAGGTVFVYKPLAMRLAGCCGVIGIQDQSHHGKDLVFLSMEDMASYYVEALCKVHTGREVLLGGASFGATVAFEMARQLEALGRKVMFLGLFDGWVRYPDAIMTASTHELLEVRANRHIEMADSERTQLLAREARRRQLLLDYAPEPAAFGATLFKAESIWPEFLPVDSADNGWGALFGERLTLQRVAGDHLTMLELPHVASLADKIRNQLAHLTECSL